MKYLPETGEWYRQDGRKVKLSVSREKGYVRTRITVKGRAYTANKLAVYWVTGEYPLGGIQFMDEDPTNLAWNNLYMHEFGDLRTKEHTSNGVSPNFDFKCGWPKCEYGIYSNKSNFCKKHRNEKVKQLEIISNFSKDKTGKYLCEGKIDLMFDKSRAFDAAMTCLPCENTEECYQTAVKHGVDIGVWGGVLFSV